MTGYRLWASSEKGWEALRKIDPGVGEEGILLRASDLNKWLERMEQWGDGLELRLESKEMNEREFYGLAEETLVLMGLRSGEE